MLSHVTVTAASPLGNLVSELRTDIESAKAVPALAAGFTTGLGLLVAQIAFWNLIFSGLLAPYTSQGVGLVLFGNFAACLVIALAGGFRGAISGLSPALVVVMAQIGATMDADGDALFVTTAGALMMGAVATGLCFLLIGRYRLANLVRFIPYSVAGGFVAGIGGAVCLAAMSLMGADTDWRAIPALVEPSALWRWGPGAAFGIALYLAIKRWGHPLILPVSVALAVGAFHLLLSVLDISGDEARVAGLLLKSTSDGSFWPAFRPTDLAQVDWTAIGIQLAYRLRGYIFFGSVCPLADHLRKSLSGDSRPTCLMLDFAAVSGFDFSAVTVLARFLQSANTAGVQVVLSAPPEQLRTLLERNLRPSDLALLRTEPDVDRALERCEEIVIQAWNANASLVGERRASLLERAVDDLERHLERQIRFEDLMDELRNWLTPCRYADGAALAGPGAPSKGLQLLTSGRASAHEAAGRRFRQYGPGDAIWPADPSDEKAPAVIADKPCETLVLTPDARRWLEMNEERLALKLYRYLLARRFEAEPNASRPE